MLLATEVVRKLESLSQDDYNMVVMLIERLSDKPSNYLKNGRDRMLKRNPMSMEDIDVEIQRYRRETRG